MDDNDTGNYHDYNDYRSYRTRERNGRLWVLGAADPEMEAIETMLRAGGEYVAYASRYGSGVRVRAGEAYADDLTLLSTEPAWPGGTPAKTTVYLVECGEPPGLDEAKLVHIDHHRPGDPGFGRPSSEFLDASSLGQVIKELGILIMVQVWYRENGSSYYRAASEAILATGWERVNGGDHHDQESTYEVGPWEGEIAEALLHSPQIHLFPDGRWHVRIYRDGHELGGCQAWLVIPKQIVFTAAADQCLGAAYQGECPGVDPDELMRFRVESRARFQGRPSEDVLADIEAAHAALDAAPKLVLAGRQIADIRAQRVRELVDAGTRYAISYIAHGPPDSSGRTMTTCSGPPEVIRAFIDQWAPEQGLTDIYGDPARGFAGGYCPNK